MTTRCISVSLVLLVVLATGRIPSDFVFSPVSIPPSNSSQLSTALCNTSVIFIENVGQFDQGARFQVRGGNGIIWLTEQAIWVTVMEPVQQTAMSQGVDISMFHSQLTSSSSRRGVHLKLSFVGANPQPRLEPVDRLETSLAYFIGNNDPASWHAEVPVWGGVRYKELYPGIDLEINSDGKQMAWEVVARPEADLSAVRLRVEGAKQIVLDGDRLHLITTIGEYTLPLLQVADADRAGLSHPVVSGDQVISPLAQSPIANSNPSISDSSSLLYATFLGGGGSDFGRGVAVDSSGAAYIVGDTQSTDFPTTPGVFDQDLDGVSDIIVAKLNPAGSALVYATFIGGSDWDWSNGVGNSIAVDSSGAVYITGGTRSPDFPTTPGAYDTSINGECDVIVAKLDATGSSLEFATYLGSSFIEDGYDIAIDASGAVYVTGETWSPQFPTTVGAFDRTYNGDRTDVFVTKLNPIGSGLVYSTFLGGWGTEDGYGIAVDSVGSAYVTGDTLSHNFPTTPGAFDTSHDYETDAFVVKLNPAGSALVYGTFIGGEQYDSGMGIAVDSNGAAYIAGGTTSTGFPVTPGAFDTSYNDPNRIGYCDAFVAKINPAGSALAYATYLGGKGYDAARGLAINSNGEAYAMVDTLSYDFPTTQGAFDSTRNGDDDVAIAKLDTTGSTLLYATYLGGGDKDYPWGITTDSSGAAYVAGWTDSVNFPATEGAYDTSYNGGTDVFIAKIQPISPTSTNVDAYIQTPALIGAPPGGVAVIPVSYGNNGATTAISPVLTATLPSELIYLDDTSGISPTVSGNTISWTLPDLAFPNNYRFTLLLGMPPNDPLGRRYPVHFELVASGVEDRPDDNTVDLEVMAAQLIFLPLVRQ